MRRFFSAFALWTAERPVPPLSAAGPVRIRCAVGASVKDQAAAEIILLTHNEDLHGVNLGWHPRAEDVLWRPDLQQPKRSENGSWNVRYRNAAKASAVQSLRRMIDARAPGCTCATPSDAGVGCGAGAVLPPRLGVDFTQVGRVALVPDPVVALVVVAVRGAALAAVDLDAGPSVQAHVPEAVSVALPVGHGVAAQADGVATGVLRLHPLGAEGALRRGGPAPGQDVWEGRFGADEPLTQSLTRRSGEASWASLLGSSSG